jgi:serine/threonine protein kinase
MSLNSSESVAFAAGTILADTYRLEELIGHGGMGYVVAAKHLASGQPVAVKFLHAALLGKDDLVRRFHREGRVIASIVSPHVARVFAVGTTPEGVPYLVMERLEGIDLAQLLRARGPLPIPEAANYVRQACAGLEAAHALGIVHRDLKPGNLFLTRADDGSALVKVLDFGVSKIQAPELGEATLTNTEALLGSPQYMAPEQIRAAHSVDARADVWSMGILLFRILTGRQAFACETPAQTFAAVLMDPPPRLGDVLPGASEALCAVIAGCLERDRDKRLPSVTALAEGLAPFAAANVPAGPWQVDSRRGGTTRSGRVAGGAGTSMTPPSFASGPSGFSVPSPGIAPHAATQTIPIAGPTDTELPAQGQPTYLELTAVVEPRASMAPRASIEPPPPSLVPSNPSSSSTLSISATGSVSYADALAGERRRRKLAIGTIAIGACAIVALSVAMLGPRPSAPAAASPTPTTSATPLAPPPASPKASAIEPASPASAAVAVSASATASAAAPSVSPSVPPPPTAPTTFVRPPGGGPVGGPQGDPFADRL